MYKPYVAGKYGVKNGRAGKFFVHDLTEPANKQWTRECVNFVDNHVYHFSSLWMPLSFSHIVVLEDGRLKIFRAVNCPGKGDDLETVISYLSDKLKNDKARDEIIERVKNYRRYGAYFTVDDKDIKCEEITKN
jgi:hypothetical protein